MEKVIGGIKAGEEEGGKNLTSSKTDCRGKSSTEAVIVHFFPSSFLVMAEESINDDYETTTAAAAAATDTYVSILLGVDVAVERKWRGRRRRRIKDSKRRLP